MNECICNAPLGECTFETCNPFVKISPPAVVSGLFCGKETISGSRNRVLVISKALVSFVIVTCSSHFLKD